MLKPLLLEASAWLAVLLDEDGSERIADTLQKNPLVSTELIRFEAANGLVYAHRKQRLLPKKTSLNVLLRVVADFPIEIAATGVWWKEAVRLVGEYPLTFYDASYLACAIELRLPLLTLDGRILDVMKREKLPAS